jgi:hypothetical protein
MPFLVDVLGVISKSLREQRRVRFELAYCDLVAEAVVGYVFRFGRVGGCKLSTQKHNREDRKQRN